MISFRSVLSSDQAKRSKRVTGGLAQQAYLKIRERILSGKMPFGASISRRELSAELGMSTLPVSDALRRLEDEKLIQSVPRVGTVVRIPTRQDVIGFYVVREALESQAARLFAEQATLAERQDLTDAAARLDEAYQRCATSTQPAARQVFDLRKQHMDFHLKLASGAHCPFLREAIERNQILIFNWLFDQLFGSPGLPDDWHSALARVLVERDTEAADRAMRRHVRFRMQELLVRLEPYFNLNVAYVAKVGRARASGRRKSN